MEYQRILTSEGRALEVSTLGDPQGGTIVFHHGSPGASSSVAAFSSLASSGEFYFVASSRAGYGASERVAGRDVAAVVRDTDAVLDALGRSRYLSVGWSGGGPHALACAALDAPRCLGAWSLAGVAPVDADFDWTAGMGPENVLEFELAKTGGPEYEAAVMQVAAAFVEATPENIIELFGGLLSEVDQRAMASLEMRTAMATAARRAFASGAGGYLDDDHAFMSPWGFSLSAITTPVEVWYGDHDLMVPPTHGAWLGANLAHATARRFSDEGHVSLVSAHLDELAASWRAHLASR